MAVPEFIPVVTMGLGHIGREIARAALAKPELRIVAAVDPSHAGRKLDAVLGRGAPDVVVSADAAEAFGVAGRGGVVLHATRSELDAVLPELEQAVRAGLCVVSTCEELAWPFHREEEAKLLNALCEENDVAVLGVGVNPGFVLDRLPAFLSQATGPVRHVRALRVQDAARRRAALQRKAGAGLDVAAFEAAAERGDIGHVGLAESAMLIAFGCRFEVADVEEQIEPVLAERDVDAAVPVKAGQVAGLRQELRGFDEDGTERVHLELVLASGASDERDEVEIDAEPPVRAVLRGGLPGDLATAWAVVHAAPAVTALPPGIATVMDLPAGRFSPFA